MRRSGLVTNRSTIMIISCFFLFTVIVAADASVQKGKVSGRSDLYRYEDDAGRLYLVDDLDRIPPAYRDRAQRIRYTSDEFRLMNRLSVAFQKGQSPHVVSRMYLAYVFGDAAVVLWWGMLLISLFLPLAAKHPLSRLNIVLASVILLVVVHLVIVAPRQCIRARSFHRTWHAANRIPLMPERQARLDSMVLHRFSEPIPLNPFNFQGRVLTMTREYRRALMVP